MKCYCKRIHLMRSYNRIIELIEMKSSTERQIKYLKKKINMDYRFLDNIIYEDFIFVSCLERNWKNSTNSNCHQSIFLEYISFSTTFSPMFWTFLCKCKKNIQFTDDSLLYTILIVKWKTMFAKQKKKMIRNTNFALLPCINKSRFSFFCA